MRQTLQGLKPRIDRLSYLKTGNRIRTAIINETGHCDISEDVIQSYMDKKAKKERPIERYCHEPDFADHIDYSPCDGLNHAGTPKPASRRAKDRKEVIAPKIEGLNYFPEDGDKIKEMDKRRAELKPKKSPPKPEHLPALTNPPSMGPGKKTIYQVAGLLGVSVEDMLSPNRGRKFAEARCLAVRLLRERNPVVYSFPRLAKMLGGKDKSTIIYVWQNFDVFVKRNPRVFDAYVELGGKMTWEEATSATP